MGFLDRLRFVSRVASQEVSEPAEKFAVLPSNVDPALFGLPSYASTSDIAPIGRVSRDLAMQVGAVSRGVGLIAGTLGTLPMFQIGPDNKRSSTPLLEDPEEAFTYLETISATVEDMIFEGVAWWRVTQRAWHGYPVKVVRLDPTTVDVRQGNRVFVRADGSTQGTAWEYVPDADLIRFGAPAPNKDGLLRHGARAIRTALKLEAAAGRYADEPQPQAYFSPADGADPTDDDEVQGILDGWQAARLARATGYVPAALKYNEVNGWAPKDMQLVEARQHAVLEIARFLGVDPEDLGVSTTSRTYDNGVDRRQALIDFTVGHYATAIAHRLSKGDVTPRGYRVRFDYTALVKGSEADRLTTYAQGVDMGLYSLADVAQREELPKPPGKPKPDPQVVQPMPQQAQQSSEPDLVLSRETGLTFDAPAVTEAFKVDSHARTVTGLVVPYGAVANKGGRKFRFSKGSLKFADIGRVKLLRDHNASQAIGVAVKATETPQGMVATFKVARGAAGDEALALAEDGVLDGFSVGVDFEADGVNLADDGVLDVLSAAWRETSLTAVPAFDAARVSNVTASHTPEGTFAMPDATTEPQAPAAPAAAPAVDVSGLADAISGAIREGFASFTPPAVIPAAPGARAQVTEAPCYRFDGGVAQYSFSKDLIAGLGKNDSEANGRMEKFMSETFNVTVANAATLNPNRQRPDMYVDQAEFTYPIWNTIDKGTLPDATPFVLPKFSSSSNLVGDHTEGSEPAGAGALTTTSQTVTPTALSGKTVINREVWDQGGNPRLDAILWRQIIRAYYEGLEAYAVTSLNAIAGSITDLTITTAAADSALEASITSNLASLQYVRGGNRFRDFLVQIDLYKALAAAKDSNGRKLFPIINPQNATGTSEAFYTAINVGGLVARPAWALAPTGVVAASSWLFDREVVCGWATAPQKFTMDAIKVATVEVGVWGYKAFACTDTSFVREVVYDPV